MIIEQPPKFFRKIYSDALFRMNAEEKTIYLTFDDGPDPKITPWVLDVLARYNVKATFFMVGDNVRKHHSIYQRVVDAGHYVGNHTFNHIKGFEHSTKSYMENTALCNEYVHSTIFRPPHGHMTMRQYRQLKKKYHIIMWDVVTRDYNTKQLRWPQVLAYVMKYTRNGSIITFHDSIKSWANLEPVLPKAIEFLLEEGYTFKTLDLPPVSQDSNGID